ncbi:hypothetical protein [Thiocapsa sp.]|uniref:hypothetical protein n=1 Tax=Thiocapsa sp. TaxID=2024551 RepID=UPI002601AEF8|nr:hypothetical protein [Thiocapsa sp.]
MADNPAESRRIIAAQSREDRGPQGPDSDIQVTALLVLESVVRYYVQATGKIDEQQVRTLLEQTFPGEPLMETFIDKYIAQGKQLGEQRGEAKILLRLIERKFGPPSETVRHRITEADSETLLEWSDRILEARSLDEVLH